MKCEHCKDTFCSERKTAGPCTRYGVIGEQRNIEIPFGAFDSELRSCEYTIPEGYEAEIKDGKVIIRKADCEDEKIREEIINYFRCQSLEEPTRKEIHNKWIAWLEKQGKHANFRNKIQIGDKVTKNQDGVLVNLSQLKRVAKKDEKQGEQKPDDKAEPKFKVGDWVVIDDEALHIKEITEDGYLTDEGGLIPFRCDEEAHLWTIQDAKDGDVLYSPCCKLLWIYKDNNSCYVGNNLSYNENCVVVNSSICIPSDVCPATKEQRDLLFQIMKEADYEWDAEKKELKKEKVDNLHNYLYGEQKPDWSKEDEKYLKLAIDNFQTLGNSFLTTWLKSLKERVQPKQEWSEEDESRITTICIYLQDYSRLSGSESRTIRINEYCDWLKSIKERVQPKQEWKQENTGDLTDFENAMMHIGGSFFGDNAGLDPNDTNAIKEQANLLLELVPKQEWSEEDREMARFIGNAITNDESSDYLKQKNIEVIDAHVWLDSLKDRVLPQSVQKWSEEDKDFMYDTLSNLTELKDRYGEGYGNVGKCIDWLKSLRSQPHWKPSDEMLEALYRVIPENVMEKSENEILLDKLYQGLKYGRVLSKD